MKKTLFIAITLLSQPCYADTPLTVENLIADQGKITMELGLTYGNKKASSPTFGGLTPVQISEQSSINIPTTVSDERVQDEFLVSTLGVKYGIIKNLDLSLKTNFIYTSNRFLNPDTNKQSSSNTDIADVTVGANYQFLPDTKYPALIGFIEATAFERNDFEDTNLSGWAVGLTTYRSYDPIVLSLTTGYKFNQSRHIQQGIDYKPADVLFFNPQLAFAANDRISLITGLNFRHLSDQEVNGEIAQKKINNLDYSFGIGYGISDQSNLNVITTTRQDFDHSSEIRLTYSKRF